MMTRKQTLQLVPLFFLLVACNLASPPPTTHDAVPTMPYVLIAQVDGPQQQPTRNLQPIPTSTDLPATQTPLPTPAQFRCSVEPNGEHIQHRVSATLNYASKVGRVAQEIRYINQEGVALGELILDVQANAWPDGFALEELRLNGVLVSPLIDRNRVTVPLQTPLNPACEALLQLTFTITPPPIGLGANSFKGYYGYSPRQWNLSLWLPTIAARFNNEWRVHQPLAIGEQVVLEQADWDVTLRVEEAAASLQIAAPGSVEQLDETTWRYVFNSARDFSISLSESFRVHEATSASGVQIQVYTFGDAVRSVGNSTLDGGQHALEASLRSFEQYEALFGPYPYERLLIVMGDFSDGMEFSGLAFVSTNWFYGFQGGVQNYLTLITIHEVSHQWWYARVGNDSAYAPWLDEALATYSEYIYFEEYYPALKEWWWSFRVGFYGPQGQVDGNVYQFATARDYINAVYLRGVLMLDSLRQDLGTQAFFDLLAGYAQAGDGEIATPELFWSLLTPTQLDATSQTRREFLAQPDVVESATGG